MLDECCKSLGLGLLHGEALDEVGKSQDRLSLDLGLTLGLVPGAKSFVLLVHKDGLFLLLNLLQPFSFHPVSPEVKAGLSLSPDVNHFFSHNVSLNQITALSFQV